MIEHEVGSDRQSIRPLPQRRVRCPLHECHRTSRRVGHRTQRCRPEPSIGDVGGDAAGIHARLQELSQGLRVGEPVEDHGASPTTRALPGPAERRAGKAAGAHTVDALRREPVPLRLEAGDRGGKRARMGGEIVGVDRPHRHAGEDGKLQAGQPFGEAREHADMIRAPGTATRQYQREVGRVAPRPRRPCGRRGLCERPERRDVTDRTHDALSGSPSEALAAQRSTGSARRRRAAPLPAPHSRRGAPNRTKASESARG